MPKRPVRRCPVCLDILSDMLLDRGVYWCRTCIKAWSAPFVSDIHRIVAGITLHDVVNIPEGNP